MARWEWEGNKREGAMPALGLMGSLSCPPKKANTLLTEVRESVYLAAALRRPGHRSPGGFNIPLFPLTLI